MEEIIADEKQARRWCFTWNNYPGTAFEDLKVLKYKFLICGLEIAPTTGTPHIQGYVEFTGGTRFSTLKKKGPKQIRWMICSGSQQQNIDYCSKGEQPKEEWEKYRTTGPNYGLNADVYTDGEAGEQGKRNDIVEATQMITEGASMRSVAASLPSTFVKYHKGLEKFEYLLQQEKAESELRTNLRVEYWWGDAGTGKTRTAWEENPGAFMVSEGLTGFWWTGYRGQKTVIMDEFRGNIPLGQLLRILDIYPVQVSIHGGSTFLAASKIIITSNLPLEDIYSGVDETSRQALHRRIHSQREFRAVCDGDVSGGVILDPPHASGGPPGGPSGGSPKGLSKSKSANSTMKRIRAMAADINK